MQHSLEHEKCVQNFRRKISPEGSLEKLGVDRRILLKLVLKKFC